MYVGVIGGDPSNEKHFKLVDDTLEALCEEKDIYLFNMFSARIEGIERVRPSLAQQYAAFRGLPCYCKEYKTPDALIKGICEKVDYLIILNDGSQAVKRCFMSYKQTGKHGSMIDV